MTKAGAKRPVWITGIGLLSTLGEGPDAHWAGLNAAGKGQLENLEAEKFAPYFSHALGDIDWANQISRRDMRQMEPWQQIGTYAAGLALDDAGVKDNEDILGEMDMIVAAGGGERDLDVDSAVLKEARDTNDVDSLMAERLSNDLRPTLFLAQLSNLLAGNISIVHKVTGSSRTFMGEEGAGVSAVKTSASRIAARQSEIALVGGAFNGERADMMLVFELGQYLMRDKFAPVWERAKADGGFATGSIGAFLILESPDHAKARGAKPYAQIDGIAASHGRREAGAAQERLQTCLEKLNPKGMTAVMSGATGVSGVTMEENAAIQQVLPNAPVRAYGSAVGHSIEAQFPFGIAIGALALSRGEMLAPLEKAEQASETAPDSVIVTSVGHYRSEAAGLLTRAET